MQFQEHGQLITATSEIGYLTLENIEKKKPEKKLTKKDERQESEQKDPYFIRSFSLAIKTGEFMGIIGPSGAGKSTLLKAIRAITSIDSGNILVFGKNIKDNPELLKEIAFVPQDDKDIVIPELTVEENLRFAAELRLPSDWLKTARDDRVNEIISSMGLQESRNNLCSQISGGQRKRVNLGLELILDSTFLLVDEACSGLSALDTDNVLKILREQADSGKAVILTIHSPDIDALDCLDTLLVLDVGCRIAYYGPAKDAVKFFDRAAPSYKSPKRIFEVLEDKKPEVEIQEDGTKKRVLKRKTSPDEWAAYYERTREYSDYLKAGLDEAKALEKKSF